MPPRLQATNILNVFHSAPYWLRVVFASLHGWRLQKIRYSPKTDALVADAISREGWTAGQWKVWQEERLAHMLLHAAKNVPYYRNQWQERRKLGDNASLELLQNWPVLDKETIRADNRAFIADTVNPKSQIAEHTSGTTGKPLSILLGREAVRQWYALFEARWRGWYGLSRHDRWGILGGQLVVPFHQNEPPFWIWNAGMNQLYLSSYHLSSPNIIFYLDAIQRHRVVYLLGYASSLFSLAQSILEQNLKVPVLKAVISNAEPLYVHQRETIARAFHCPVYDTYGLSENICAASECLQGNLHLWLEAGITEILDDDSDATLAAGETGRIVCTGLLNPVMPLIRYDTGDRGFLAANSACSCGRQMPILGGIEGRKDDVILTRDGRRIGRLDPVFKSNLPIKEAQIVQESLDGVVVKYVPAPGCAQKDLDSLSEKLQERLGGMKIILTAVDRIPRSANGKFKAVVSNLKAN